MTKIHSHLNFVRRSLALTAFAGASLAVANAQQLASPAPAPTTLNLTVPQLNAPDAMFSSSSADNEVAGVTNHFDFVDSLNAQPGQRRYGRPRYRGGNTNPDGSNKYIFFGAAGFTQPIGNTYHYLTPNYGIQVGGGRQFSEHFAVPIQFDYDHFGFNGRTLSNQSFLYTDDPVASDNGIDGSSHVWSFTVDPTYTFYGKEGVGAYVVGGVGFYHKVADFTAPQEEEYCQIYCQVVAVQADFDHYTSNAVGFNGGLGLTYKISRFSSEKFFLEARYVFVDNQQRKGVTVNNYTTASATATNLYPANSNRTTYIPVKVGVRF